MDLNSWLNLFSSSGPSLLCVVWFHYYLKYRNHFSGRISIRKPGDILPAAVVGGFPVFLMPITVLPLLGREICKLVGFDYRLDVGLSTISFAVFYPLVFLTYRLFFFKTKFKP